MASLAKTSRLNTALQVIQHMNNRLCLVDACKPIRNTEVERPEVIAASKNLALVPTNELTPDGELARLWYGRLSNGNERSCRVCGATRDSREATTATRRKRKSWMA